MTPLEVFLKKSCVLHDFVQNRTIRHDDGSVSLAASKYVRRRLEELLCDWVSAYRAASDQGMPEPVIEAANRVFWATVVNQTWQCHKSDWLAFLDAVDSEDLQGAGFPVDLLIANWRCERGEVFREAMKTLALLAESQQAIGSTPTTTAGQQAPEVATIAKTELSNRAPGRRLRPIRKPSELQNKLATAYDNSNSSQRELAESLSKMLGKTIRQDTISKAVKAVNRWRKRNPDLGLTQIQTRPDKRGNHSVSPDDLDHGERRDGRTLRQRPTAEADE